MILFKQEVFFTKMYFIPRPYSMYIMLSSNQFLISSYYAYICDEYVISSLIFSVYITSLLLWYNPIDGIRKRLDSTLVTSTTIYFLYLSKFNAIVYLGTFCMLFTHCISYHLFYQKKFHLSAYCHLCIHFLGNIINIYLIYHIHLLKMLFLQETPQWTDRCLLDSP